MITTKNIPDFTLLWVGSYLEAVRLSLVIMGDTFEEEIYREIENTVAKIEGVSLTTHTRGYQQNGTIEIFCTGKIYWEDQL